MIMAAAYPDSDFTGFDYHDASIEAANEKASARASFAVASAQDFPGTDYDFVTTFDCLHDMGDPVAAAQHIRQALAPDGTWLLVEPFAGDTRRGEPQPRRPRLLRRLDARLHARVDVPGGRAGARCPGRRGALRDVVTAAGFTRFRRVAETPFNLVFEVRP